MSIRFIYQSAFVLLSSLGIFACDSLKGSQKYSDGRYRTTVSNAHTPPVHLDTAEEQAEYLIKHYWDDTDFANLVSRMSAEDLEQKIADFLGLVLSFPLEKHKADLLLPLEKSNDKTLLFVLSTYREYLYEANSPIASDEFYKPILEWAIHTPKLTLEYQEQARLLLSRLNLNMVGYLAQNFIYTKLDQSRHHLHNQQHPHTLVIFTTPNCTSCTTVIEQIQKDKTIQQKIERGDLGVLVIYIQCTQEEFASVADTSHSWLQVGYDASGEILDKPLYDIKASPTIYLISRSGKVILKDLSPEHLNQITTYN